MEYHHDMIKTYKEKDETFISYEAVVVDYDYDESDFVDEEPLDVVTEV